jgi:uncharacterized protein (TIGR04255 family)
MPIEPAKPSIEFENPPLSEVALSVQTEPIKGLTTPFLGLFWQEIRNSYPKVEVQPALDPVIEQFGEPTPAVQRGLRILDAVETPRCWFISADDQTLVQLQQDRMAYNWRARPGALYPRYSSLRPAFEAHFKQLIAFVAREQLGDVVPNQCEVSYVNHISPDEWGSRGELYRALAFWSPFANLGLSEPEDVALATRFLLKPSGSPLRRMHLSLNTAKRQTDDATVLVFALTVRGAPAQADMEGVLSFMDDAREEIHRAFGALTTDQIQRDVWRRK